MEEKIYPAGTGVTTRNAAELLSADMNFMGTSVAATADAVGYDTKFSTARVAIAGLLAGYDTVIAEYKDATTITVKAGGQYSANGILYTIAADFDLSTSTGLSADDTLTADTWYYIVTNGTTYKLSDAATCSDVSNGVALGAGISIYNDAGTLKIRPFDYDGRWYRYRSDVTVYTGTAPTSLTALDLSAYCPANVSTGTFQAVGDSTNTGCVPYVRVSFENTGGVAVCYGFIFALGEVYYDVLAVTFTTSIRRQIYWSSQCAHTNAVLYLQSFQIGG